MLSYMVSDLQQKTKNGKVKDLLAANSVLAKAKGWCDEGVGISINRQIEYYLYNMLLMVFSITMVGGFVWTTKPVELCCRLQLDFVVLLVSQAFKLAISHT